MKKVILMALLFTFLGGVSQSTYLNINTTNFEVGNSIFETDSNYLIFGGSVDFSVGQYNQTQNKFDKFNGNLLLRKILIDSFNSYYLHPHSTIKLSDGNFLTASHVQRDSFLGSIYGGLTKLSPNFDTIWHRNDYPDWDSIRPSDPIVGLANRLFSVKELPTGDLLCLGDYYRGNSYDYDGYVMKTDSLGNYLWHVVFGNVNDWARSYDIELGDSGSFYIMGIWVSPGIKLAKYDSIGNQIWVQTYFPIDTITVPYQMTKTYDSCFVIAYSKLYLYDGYDFWSYIKVIKVRQKDGQLVWSKYFRHNVDNEVYGITELLDSNLIIYGMTDYWNPYDFSLHKNYGLLLKISSEGDSIWSRLIHKQPGEDQAFYDLKQTSDKGFVATGQYMDNSLAHTTLWLVKMDSLGCTDPNCLDTLIGGVEMLQFKEDYLVVYPNPVSEKLIVGMNVPGLEIDEIQIFDIHGRLVHAERVQSSSFQINVRHFKSGIYMLQVIDKDGIVSAKKFVKE